jgi:hypothetical protein
LTRLKPETSPRAATGTTNGSITARYLGSILRGAIAAHNVSGAEFDYTRLF